MAVVIQDTDSSSAMGTKTLTFAGGDRACIVISCGFSTGANAGTVTCGGVAMTVAQNVSAATRTAAKLFYLAGVAAGNVDVVMSGMGGTQVYWAVWALSGVNQVVPLKESVGAGQTTSPLVLTFSVADTTSPVLWGATGLSVSDPSGYTLLVDQSAMGIGHKASGVSATESISVTANSADYYGFCGVAGSINTASGGGTSVAIAPFLVFFDRLKWGALWQPKGGLIYAR